MVRFLRGISDFARRIGHAATSGDRGFRRALAAIAALAAVLRVLHAVFVHRALGDVEILDAEFYRDQARFLIGALAAPAEPGPVSFANPGYPYLLAAVFGVLGDKPLVAEIVQAAFGAITAIGLALASTLLWRDRAAALRSALLWALYAPAIYYDGSLLIPSATAFLTAFALFVVARLLARSQTPSTRGLFPATVREQSVTQERRVLLCALAAGAAVGASALLRPSNVLLGLLLAAALPLLRRDRSRTLLARSAAILLLGVLSIIAPRVIQQSSAGGAFIPISANGGMNFWVGNNATSSGIYSTAPFLEQGGQRAYTVVNERNGFLDEARRRSENPDLTLAQSSDFWRTQAFRDICESPSRWLELEAKKFLGFWNDYEPRTNASFAFVSRFSPILRFDPVTFGVLAPSRCIGRAAPPP